MPYNIYQSNGQLITVPDNAIDTQFYNPTGGGGIGGVPPGQGQGIQLVGRNALNYGSATAQNFVQLTENFCSGFGFQPSDATVLQGQIWFEKDSNTTGNLWVRTSVNGASTGLSFPGPTWTQIVTGASGTATSANNLTGGVATSVPYQTAPGVTAMSAAGTNGQVLTLSGTTPTWTNPGSIVIGTATNLAGGAANEIPYQTGPGVTTFMSAPSSASTYLEWNGSSFVWSSVVASDATAVTITNDTSDAGPLYPTFVGGNSGAQAVKVNSSNLLYYPLTGELSATLFNGLAAQSTEVQINNASALTGPFAVLLTTTLSGSFGAGQETPQADPDLNFDPVSDTLTVGTGTGNVVAGTFTGALVGNATTATTATNLAGGSDGSIPYQTTGGSTSMLSPGTSGYILQTNGAAAPSWVSPTAVAPGALGWFSVYNTTSGALYDTTGTVIFNTSNGAVGCTYSGGTGDVTVTVSSGTQVWALNSSVTWAKNEDGASSSIVNEIQNNGGAISSSQWGGDPNDAQAVPIVCTSVVSIGVGSHIFRVQCTSNSNTNLNGYGSFSGIRIA
jgi:hypothetical protein